MNNITALPLENAEIASDISSSLDELQQKSPMAEESRLKVQTQALVPIDSFVLWVNASIPTDVSGTDSVDDQLETELYITWREGFRSKIKSVIDTGGLEKAEIGILAGCWVSIFHKVSRISNVGYLEEDLRRCEIYVYDVIKPYL